MTVEYLIPTKLFRNVPLLRAFTRIPRVEFVPRRQRNNAYLDVEILSTANFAHRARATPRTLLKPIRKRRIASSSLKREADIMPRS